MWAGFYAIAIANVVYFATNDSRVSPFVNSQFVNFSFVIASETLFFFPYNFTIYFCVCKCLQLSAL